MEQPLGGGDDAGLGEGIHAGGRLVQHDDLHVPHQQPGEGEQLLLPRGQDRAAGAEQGVDAVVETGDPVTEPQLGQDLLDPVAGRVGEQRDVLREGAGQDLGALRDDTHGATELLQVEVQDVDPAEEDLARTRVDRARDQRGERRLARPRASDERQGLPRGQREVDVAQRERALGIREGRVAELQGHRAWGQLLAAVRLRLDGHHLAQAQDGAEPRLQVGQLVGDATDVADERRGDEEERDELGDGQPVGRGEHDPDGGDGGEQGVQDDPGAQGHRALEGQHLVEAPVHLGGQRGKTAYGERLAEARPQVVLRGDALLEGCGMVGPRGLLHHLAPGDLVQEAAHGQDRGSREDREQEHRRPPGEAGDDEHRDDRDDGAQHHPDLDPHEGADLAGVVVDAVEDLPHRLLRQRRERLAQRGVEQVVPQPPLGPVGHGGPQPAAEGVDGGSPDDAGGEHPQEGPRDLVGEPPRHHGAERRADGSGGERQECRTGRGAPEAVPGHGAVISGASTAAGHSHGERCYASGQRHHHGLSMPHAGCARRARHRVGA